MKRLALALALAPSGLLAHGAHPPVAEAAHGMAHVGLNVGLAIVALAAVLALLRRIRS